MLQESAFIFLWRQRIIINQFKKKNIIKYVMWKEKLLLEKLATLWLIVNLHLEKKMFWNCYLCSSLALEWTTLAIDELADTYLVN